MLVNIYAIYDSKVRAHLQPWFAQNHNVAFRNLELAMKNPQCPFVQFPADYTLFCIGQFDDETAKLIPADVFENLGNMIQFAPPPGEASAEPPLPFPNQLLSASKQ